MTLPDNLPALLRSEGLKVHVLSGWKTRGRPAYTGGFDPVGVLCHHTATGPSTSDKVVLRLLRMGRSDLPGPLAQLGLSRDGTVHVIAAGRANHAGTAKTSGTVAGGDGNRLYIGIEAFNDGVGEPWPKAQYDAYVTLAAALCKHVTGNSPQTVRGHKETSTSGKVDPTFDMGTFRRDVDRTLRNQRPVPKEDDMPDPKDLWDSKAVDFIASPYGEKDNPNLRPRYALAHALQHALAARQIAAQTDAKVDALVDALEQLAPGVKAAAAKGAREALAAGIDITVTANDTE